MLHDRLFTIGSCYVPAIVCAIVSSAFAKQENEPFRYYYASADVISLDSKQSLASYRSEGGVSGSAGANIGCSTPGTAISIRLTVESDHFYADVTLEPKVKEAKEGKKNQRVDLTDLRPTSIDVGSDKDGRTYQLNLVPSVKTVAATAKPFEEIANDLYQLNFHSSRLMLNDKQYIGRMLATDAEKFSVDICGIANIEFSLYHLKGAEPWGRLQNGQITFRHPDGTTIEISNVTNGAEDRVVDGGPYTVWVRWKKPNSTVEEFRAAMKAQREQLKLLAGGAGTGDTLAKTLKTIDQELAREPGPWVIGCGASGVPKSEIVREE